jgi:hypothetical protein
MNASKMLVAVFVSPGAAFDRLRNCRTSVALLPLSIMVITYSFTFVVYYNIVDLDWLRERLTQDFEPAARAGIMKNLTVTTLSSGALVGTLFSVPAISLFYATYLHLAGQVMNLERQFQEWLALVTWSSLPGLLLAPLGIVNVALASNGQITPSDINPTTLNQLLLHLPESHTWKALLDNFSVLSIWSYVLLALGFRALTQVSVLRSTLISLAPAVTGVGLWALVIVARSLS